MDWQEVSALCALGMFALATGAVLIRVGQLAKSVSTLEGGKKAMQSDIDSAHVSVKQLENKLTAEYVHKNALDRFEANFNSVTTRILDTMATGFRDVTSRIDGIVDGRHKPNA